jgi:ATP-dependent Lon protease
VLKLALTKELKPVEWNEVEKISETKKDDKSQASIQ